MSSKTGPSGSANAIGQAFGDLVYMFNNHKELFKHIITIGGDKLSIAMHNLIGHSRIIR